jgi:hypothetical protein
MLPRKSASRNCEQEKLGLAVGQSPRFSRCEQLVAAAGERSRNERKTNDHS